MRQMPEAGRHREHRFTRVVRKLWVIRDAGQYVRPRIERRADTGLLASG